MNGTGHDDAHRSDPAADPRGGFRPGDRRTAGEAPAVADRALEPAHGAGLGARFPAAAHPRHRRRAGCLHLVLRRLPEPLVLPGQADGSGAAGRRGCPVLADGGRWHGTRLPTRARQDRPGGSACAVHDDVRNAEVQDAHVAPLQELPWRPDLIVASHVTYYFGNGLGLDLVNRLASHHLAPGGRIWLVIRRLNCPIYEVRAQAIKQLGSDDP